MAQVRRGETPGLSATAAKMDGMPMVADPLTAGLDDEQREAVLAPRGPVCVLAG
ncbi:MAG: ATP-dependent helicase UvrD/PcrA, partial [Blastocatellia bacterium]|nr:ATP-dependent helicase UvrD/PcrA [Blastocatellia bacterium]